MALNADYWRGRRVLLTGHTGFKGGWLGLWLRSLGAEVMGYSLAPIEAPNLWQTASLSQVMDGRLADLRDVAALNETLQQFRPELVLHLAAQPLVRAAYRDPVETYSTNVMGTINLLEAVRQSSDVRAVLVVTTDKCYENREWDWPYRENDPMGGHDPYSSSKACVELICSSYRRSFLAERDVALATARAGNVVGGGDWSAERLVPDVFRAWQKGEEVVLRYPHATRPWQHVLEPLAGYLQLAEQLLEQRQKAAMAWNFGPGPDSVVSVEALVSQLADLWPGQAPWRTESGNQPHEAGMLSLDSTQARTRLGWKPRWDLRRSLEMTVRWQQAWLSGQDMKACSLDQIAQYQNEML